MVRNRDKLLCNREEHIFAHLDRFIVQSSLMMNNTILNTKILPKLTSEHKPIQLLLEDEEDLGPLPFHFNPLRIERESFMETVKESWAKLISGSPCYVSEQNLKAVKQALREWIKKPASKKTSQRKEIVQTMEDIQVEMEHKDITSKMIGKEVEAHCSSFRYFRIE